MANIFAKVSTKLTEQPAFRAYEGAVGVFLQVNATHGWWTAVFSDDVPRQDLWLKVSDIEIPTITRLSAIMIQDAGENLNHAQR